MSPRLLSILLTIAIGTGPTRAGELFVSNERDNTVTVLDTVTFKVVKTIPVGMRPRGIVITPDERQVLVCDGDSDDIEVIDTATLGVVRKLDPGADPETLALSPNGSVVYVSNEDDSMVTMLDFKTGAVLARIPVGIEPEGLAVGKADKTIVDVSESTSMAHFIDVATKTVVAQRPRRHAAARRRIRARSEDGVGYVRGRGHRFGDRRREPRGYSQDLSTSRACGRS